MLRGVNVVEAVAQFAVLVGLVLSVTWLVIEDRLLRRPREWWRRMCQRRGWVGGWYFVNCPFCLSPWFALAAIGVLGRWGWSFPLPVVWALVARMVVGPLHVALDRWVKPGNV